MNASENPFRAARLAELDYVGTTTGRDLAHRAAAMAFRGAIVGPPGTGKSTLLRALGRALADSALPYELTRFDRARAYPRARRTDRVLLVDGAERLSRFALRILLLCESRVVITAHRSPLGLSCLHRCDRQVATFERLMKELDPHERWHSRAAESWHSRGGDLHMVFDDLYEQAAAE